MKEYKYSDFEPSFSGVLQVQNILVRWTIGTNDENYKASLQIFWNGEMEFQFPINLFRKL